VTEFSRSSQPLLADPPGTAGAEPPRRAYVLEDDPAIAAVEADVLRDLGFGVVTCARIVELGDLIEMSLPDLLVVDVILPDGDGGDLTSLLREAWPGIPVVFVSGLPRDRLVELATLGPIVEKPFNVATFAAAVGAALEPPGLRDAV
jgi:DNA-binding response OmpR family regulator